MINPRTTDRGGSMITHERATNAHIELAIDNLLDDMHDDGIRDEWITAIATRRSSLIALIRLRHTMTCSKLPDPLDCDECTDDDFDMHFLTCRLSEAETTCNGHIEDFVYCSLLRPRWEDEPVMAKPDHIVHKG